MATFQKVPDVVAGFDFSTYLRYWATVYQLAPRQDISNGSAGMNI